MFLTLFIYLAEKENMVDINLKERICSADNIIIITSNYSCFSNKIYKN